MILVVGATGSLGRRIVQRLLALDRPVRVLARRPAAELSALGATPVAGDLKDPPSLAAAVAGAEVVVTTANSALRGGDDTVQTVDRAGNRALVDAARAAGVRQFVFVSALGASTASPVPLLRAKGETEVHLRASGMSYTIVAPHVFMDVWLPALVAAPIRAGRPVTLVGEGRRRHSLVAVDDVASLTAAVVDHPAARDRHLAFGGPEAVSWRDVVRAYEAVLGRAVPVEFVPPGSPVPGLPDPMPDLLASLETYDAPIDSAAVAETFGVSLTSVEAFVRATVDPPGGLPSPHLGADFPSR